MGEKLSTKLLDSALVLGLATAFCYGVGFNVQMNDATRRGIPFHLIGNTQPERLVMLGALYVFWISLVLAIIWLIAQFVVLVAPSISKQVRGRVAERFELHKTFYSFCGIGIAAVGLYYLPNFVDLVAPNQYGAPKPLVSQLVFEKNDVLPKPNEFEFLSRQDGLIILHNKKSNEYLLLDASKVKSIELVPALPTADKTMTERSEQKK